MTGLFQKTLRLLLCGTALFSCWCSAQTAAAKLYVDNSRGDDISVIDLGSLKVVDDIKVNASNPHGLAVSSDGSRLFVTTESDKMLRVVDVSTKHIVAAVQLTGKPNQCAVTRNGRYVAVPIRDGDSVDIVDIQQSKIVKVLPIKEPHNAFSIGSDRYLFVSSMGSHEISIIDLEKMDFSSVIPAGGRPRPYVVTPDGKLIYVAVSNLHGFNIVDVQNKKVLTRFEMPSEHPGPPRPRKFETPDTTTHGLALSPDGSELWVTSLLDDAIYVYDVKTSKIVGKVAVGDGPNWVVFSPDGKYVCVSNTDSDDVSIIDVKGRHEVARVKVGKVPKRLAVSVAPVPSGMLTGATNK